MHVTFATPSFSRTVSMEYVQSLFGTFDLFAHKGIGCSHAMLGGDCFIDKARNELVTGFLGVQSDALFFLDDDIGWKPEDALRVLLRPEEMVCGVYPRKEDKPGFPAMLVENCRLTDTGLLPATAVPTGFLRIKRGALEKMIAAYPDTYKSPYAGQVNAPACWNLFQTGRVGEEWWGEDYYFCHKWRQIGGEIWIDPNIDFTHVGRKKYAGNFANFLAQPENHHGGI